MLVDNFITDSNKAANVPQLAMMWHQAMRKVGFDRLFFTLLMNHRTIARKAGRVLAFNFPQAWLDQYSSNRYEEVDPVYDHLLTTKGAFTWESLRSIRKLTPAQIAVLDLAVQTGLHGSIGISLRGPLGEPAAVLAASSMPNLMWNKEALDCAALLSEQFYKVYLELERKIDINEAIRLTGRERQVLALCAAGRSQKEIATAIGVTLHGVNYHMRRILFKLEANNQAVAVMKAASMGLISRKHIGDASK